MAHVEPSSKVLTVMECCLYLLQSYRWLTLSCLFRSLLLWNVVGFHYRVIDGTNITMSDEHMWLVPFSSGQNHLLTINFPENVLMAGLRIWNYNKSKEDTYRGVSFFCCHFNWSHVFIGINSHSTACLVQTVQKKGDFKINFTKLFAGLCKFNWFEDQ